MLVRDVRRKLSAASGPPTRQSDRALSRIRHVGRGRQSAKPLIILTDSSPCQAELCYHGRSTVCLQPSGQ